MSVAFRREGDDEHLEPTFELPVPAGPNLVTARGLAQIQAKVVALEAAVAGIADEAERKAARRTLRYWITRQATARLVDRPDGSVVAFGCSVDFTLDGLARTIHIVGDDEADPAQGRLSFSAPLSRALMDAEVGETLDFAGRPAAITVLKITVAD